jgi:hypothetical protein
MKYAANDQVQMRPRANEFEGGKKHVLTQQRDNGIGFHTTQLQSNSITVCNREGAGIRMACSSKIEPSHLQGWFNSRH